MASVLYYCLFKFKLLPHEYMALPETERAFIIAAASIQVKKDKQEEEKAKRAGRRH